MEWPRPSRGELRTAWRAWLVELAGVSHVYWCEVLAPPPPAPQKPPAHWQQDCPPDCDDAGCIARDFAVEPFHRPRVRALMRGWCERGFALAHLQAELWLDEELPALPARRVSERPDSPAAGRENSNVVDFGAFVRNVAAPADPPRS